MSDTMQPAQVQGAPSLPQVNLLPPSVRAKRKVAVARLWLALAILIVMFLTSMGAVSTLWERKAADSELADVQDANTALVAGQSKYAEVPKVLKDLQTHQDARTFGMSTEVLWSPYLAAIAAATPLEVSIDTMSMSQDTVMTPGETVSYGPLSTPGTVGQVSVGGRALTLHAVSEWEDALSSIPGVADVEVSAIEVTGDDAATYYSVGATFRLTPDAFANQFVTEE